MQVDLTKLTRAQKLELLQLLEAKRDLRQSRGYERYYPDDGPLRRELYPKHLEFFRAGRDYRERCAMAANRIGKTEGMGGYETALHLTGDYPHWWQGRRFGHPVSWWAAGKSFESTRDIIQAKLFGPITYRGAEKTVKGTGLIPRDRIGRITWKSGVQDLIDTVEIKHDTGDWSVLGLKSYQQGRGGFEGTEKHGVWLDEECPIEIYNECTIRTATTNGIVMLTFTPLEGASETVLAFMPPDILNKEIERLKRAGEL